MNLSEKVDAIELKVRELAFKLERLKKENVVLREENKSLKVEIDRLQDSDLNGNHHTARRNDDSEMKEGEEQSEQLRDQIDQYIKEIDKCIEWLNNN